MSSLKADFDELRERIRHGREIGHAGYEIYREAWTREQQHGPGSLSFPSLLAGEGPGERGQALEPLSQTYEDEAAFLRDVRRLIIEDNLYGVDIDPRAAQIAALALWLRAQTWHDAGGQSQRPHLDLSRSCGRGDGAAGLDDLDAELF